MISLLSACPFFSCWDMNDSTALWWVIKGPVVGSIMVSVLRTKKKRQGLGRMAHEQEGDMKESPYKLAFFFVMAALYSIAQTHKLLSCSPRGRHVSYCIFFIMKDATRYSFVHNFKHLQIFL